LDAYLAVLAQHPGSKGARTHAGNLQARLGQHEAALATWTEAQKRFPESKAAHLGRVRALAALGRAEQAAFYDWAPGFLELDFATANASFLRLAPQFDEQPSDEQRQQAQRARDAEIERLLATRDAASSRVLAALCWFHEDHGGGEDRMFAELQARGAESIPLLMLLLEHGQATCTHKGAAHALARLRAPDLLPILVDLLPQDVRPVFEIDVAGAMAELGDPAAVAPLIEFADIGGPEAKSPDDHMRGYGRTRARERAVLALGALGGEQARAALAKGLDDVLLGRHCMLALYRITREEGLAEKVRKAVSAAGDYDRGKMLDYLERFAPEMAKALRGEGKR